MNSQSAPAPLLNRIMKYNDLIIAFGIIVILMLIIVPLPTVFLDIFLSINLSSSLVAFLLTLYISDTLQFSVFPTYLLMATFFRLALSIAATRLILSQGFAGNIIDSFGGFVISGNYVVGFILFLIIVIIQFVVITSGATRVAEVAARFTLDAMPGKQMAIDADLNTGLISEDQAKERRRVIEQEADFYGAMDGASKFIKGDAIVGIIIVVVNILGGFIIGAMNEGLDLMEALQKYMGLAVGNGIVTQIPALLISTATGVIVTRAGSERSIGRDLGQQIITQPKVIAIVGGLLLLLGLVPGLPKLPFIFIGGIMLGSAYFINQSIIDEDAREIEEERARQVSEARSPESMTTMLQVDPMEVEIGYGLIPIVDPDQGGELLNRVSAIRKQIALDLGFIVPPIRIRDNMQLPPNKYSIKIRGVEIAKGELMLDRLLAMHTGQPEDPIEGIKTKEPAFGLDATWISTSQKEEAELKGYTVVDPASIAATHLTEVLRSNAYELLGRQETQALLDNVKINNPVVVEELVPNLVTVGDIQKIIQNLLRERVSIRDLVTVLETIADFAKTTKDIDILTEHVRQSLARNISKTYVGDNNTLSVITLDPKLEQVVSEGVQHSEQGSYIAIQPTDVQTIIKSLSSGIESASAKGHQPIILTSPNVRLYFKRLIERTFPNVAVLSYNEITQDTVVESVGMVEYSVS